MHVRLAERPELLRESYDLASEGYADMATFVPVQITLEDWLADEEDVPEGSFVALVGGEIVRFSLAGGRDIPVGEQLLHHELGLGLESVRAHDIFSDSEDFARGRDTAQPSQGHDVVPVSVDPRRVNL